jgi:2-polyprenyl-3-methyl-5-hydroxy-6-metoxy-1,4-benzoquinol methylase
MKYASDDVRCYFDRIPAEWDALYSHENWGMYFFNRIFRPGLYDRYAFVFENCGDISGASVLDIGCGTGRYSIEFARRGAARVVGIDFAQSMVDFSASAASQMGVQDRCTFICSDLLKFPVEETFDIVVAMGFFDYVQEPERSFRRISALARGRFVASFPKDTLIWGTQRRIRYSRLKQCPIYNYTESQLNALFKNAPFREYKIVPATRGFFGVGIGS